MSSSAASGGAPRVGTVAGIVDSLSRADFGQLSKGKSEDLDDSKLTEADKVTLVKIMIKFCLNGPAGNAKEVSIGGVKTSINALFGHSVSRESVETYANNVKIVLGAAKYDPVVSESLMWHVKGQLWPNDYKAGETKAWAGAGAVKRAARVT